MQKETLASLKKVLAPRQIITHPLELVTYEVDAALDRGTPDGAVFPATADDVVRLVKWARAHRLPLVARGAGTGLSGGAVAEHGGLIVEFSRMNRILEFNEAGRTIVFEPGVVNQTLDELTKAKGLYYPPDPSSGRSATMGGTLAENAGGPHCFKYGVTTNYITGMEIVTADGARLRLGGLALDYPEYDLVGLLNGSEGTLGLITQASARLIRNPPAIQTMMAAFDTVEAAGAAVSAVIARGLVPATLEMMDQKIMRVIEDFAHAGLPVNAGAGLIVEADGYAESVASQIEEIAAVLREHQAHDLRIAQNAEERNKIWYGRKSAVGAMSRLAPQFLLLDGSVPRSRLAATLAGINAICDAAGLRVGYVFHAGDGNLHPLILIEDPDNEADVKRVLTAGSQVMELCVNMGGSITGEHGVGIEKRAFMPLMYSADELQTMREVRQIFDPENLFNPGKIFPPAAPQPAAAAAPAAPTPSGLWAPQSALEAAQGVAAAAAAGQPLRLRGGGTKSGLLPAVNTTLSTQALRGVAVFSLEDLYVTVRAGTPLAEMQRDLAQHQMWVPLVSPWAASTVGGLVATGFNAPLRMRYGAVRDLVLALTVVLPDGRLIRAGRPVVKNVAGYDMPKLFVGAHGTLGLITDVTLKLLPLPRARASLVTPVESLTQGARWGQRLLEKCLAASALILCQGKLVPGITAPYALIHTIEGMPADVATEMQQARAALTTAGVTGFQEMDLSGNEVWASEIGAPAPTETRLRLGVAPQDLAGVLSRLEATLANTPLIADLANGLLYVRSLQASVLEAVRRSSEIPNGYTVVISAPDRSSEIWNHTPDSKALMGALKTLWNPQGLFNPDAFIV